ncbi:probable protein phosphatase 2c 38 [Phtheirospermum japonicum]|uniref:Probable protein phosphatase 2c 38 n=1 Tax=Phtheirospermum japonicum TaxID=374723 RepID=A0A830B9N9_9LAMI|nr:probable protein phosphatase 2c 38 [Phtheirospermum japonicum]
MEEVGDEGEIPTDGSMGSGGIRILGHHVNGEFSMAVIQANGLMEDHSQLESGPLSSLGSGPCEFASESREMSANVIKKSFLATEDEFLSLVRQQWSVNPQLASVGTCCLVGVICDGLLYIANAGDSRVVLGRTDKAVRGISRSIGDSYLKKSEFNREPLLAKFRLPEPFSKPILSAEPSMLVHKLNPDDQFLIFASDGLWEHLSNQEAVDIVNSYPRNGIARKLVKAALRVAAKKREMRYSDLKKIDRGVRRHFHDDITVVVVFIDKPSSSMRRSSSHGSIVSIRGGGGSPVSTRGGGGSPVSTRGGGGYPYITA